MSITQYQVGVRVRVLLSFPFFLVKMFSSSTSGGSRFKPLGSDEPDIGGVVSVGGLTEAFTPEMREKMVRLEKENQILRRRVESAESAPQDAGKNRLTVCKPLNEM